MERARFETLIGKQSEAVAFLGEPFGGVVRDGHYTIPYPENFCHKTGKKSNGKTSMANPILRRSR